MDGKICWGWAEKKSGLRTEENLGLAAENKSGPGLGYRVGKWVEAYGVVESFAFFCCIWGMIACM